jgi:cyclopropane fatty-acyl-phospholipid synthase-like methyltransferase
MASAIGHVLDFYTRHPISAEQILAKVGATRGHLEDLKPEDLWPHDQDHYGGLQVNNALADRASIQAGDKLADFCAGLGGPARYFAQRFGATVIGIDLNPSRVKGAEELTRLVGLQDRVRIMEGDVTRTSLDDGSIDVVVSQEAFLHVPDKAGVLTEAFRVLKRGGRFAFTDWITHRGLTNEEADVMWRGIAAQTLQSVESYKALLTHAGFDVRLVEDLTTEWGAVLAERFAMYRRLREETLEQGLPAGDEEFYRAYGKLVELVQKRVLGGGRFVAMKPP